MNVGKSIKKLRESKELTQEQFGKIAGVSSMAVSQWENGRAVPRMGAIQRISDYFGVPKSEIMGDAAKPQHSPAPSLSPDESELVDLWRRMDGDGRALLLGMAGKLADQSEMAAGR